MKNSKPFDPWNENKKEIDADSSKILFRVGEIWWTKMGINIGIEQNGKGGDFTRPVLILKKYNHHHFLGIPLTTQKKDKKYSFHLHDLSFLREESWIIFSQIRAIDSKRLTVRIGKLPSDVLRDIEKRLKKHLFES